MLRRAGLLQKKSQDGTQTTMEATLMAQQTPGQREQVRPAARPRVCAHSRPCCKCCEWELRTPPWSPLKRQVSVCSTVADVPPALLRHSAVSAGSWWLGSPGHPGQGLTGSSKKKISGSVVLRREHR